MPCHFEPPSESNKRNQHAARLLRWLLIQIQRETQVVSYIPDWLEEETNDIYSRDERVIPLLCETINGMSQEQRKRIIYDPYSRMSRDLANWWEDHQKMDAERERREHQQAETSRLKKQAMAKLTEEERQALGFPT